jgi:Kef-type K+ transport system membrane component KefB
MADIWFAASLWLGLALLATFVSMRIRVSVALVDIIIGVAAQSALRTIWHIDVLDARAGWVVFLASVGAVLLTFLAGAELDPVEFRRSWRETSVLGLVGFVAPFLGAAAVARFVLGWDPRASWLAGVALSTTSVAVVYAVLLDLGLNRTPFGKIILAACFVNDLGTVIMLGLLFAPFTWRTLVFAGGTAVSIGLAVTVTPALLRSHGGRPSEFEAKYLLFLLFLLGGFAAWSGAEAVLPAYLIGMALAGSIGQDRRLLQRLRTLTLGFLTPFYFIRAGSLVSVPAIAAGGSIFLALFLAKAISKFVGLYPLAWRFGYQSTDAMYTTLLMSTGLTFGTISSLYGLTHGIITQGQYSFLVATVIASAVVPTWVANRFFLPHHHLPPEPGPALATETAGG